MIRPLRFVMQIPLFNGAEMWYNRPIIFWGGVVVTRICRRICAVMLAALLILGSSAIARAEENDPVRRLLAYCLHYGSKAETDILAILDTMEPEQRLLWQEILDGWRWTYEEMTVTPGVLTDGLPEDDSLCILVMGFGLNRDGSMKPELLGRLETALACARKYPNAYVACTGGETSNFRGISEAGRMRDWLVANGVAENRIITERNSLSTTENIRNTYPFLREEYPGITSVAIVTSDYHIRRSCMTFLAMVSLESARDKSKPIQLVGNAAWESGSSETEGRDKQAWGLAILAGVEIMDIEPPVLSRMTELTVEAGESIRVTATYDSGITRDVTDLASISDFDPEEPGKQRVRVIYQENDATIIRNIMVGEDIPEETTAAAPTQPESRPSPVPVVLAVVMVMYYLTRKYRGKE